MSDVSEQPEWVRHFEAALAEHYKEPVLPVSRYCRAFRDWGKALRAMVEREQHEGSERDERLHRIAGMATDLELAIMKSNLLARLIYGGQSLRTEMCPFHKGQWSGYGYDDNTCECQDGPDITGWLPTSTPKGN